MQTKEDVMNYIEEEDVRFIRLAFFDVFGKQKNISIQPREIVKAFDKGIMIDGSAVLQTDDIFDLYIVPDPTTMVSLPWRSFDGAVIRMYCDIYTVDGQHFEQDTRYLLRKAKNKISEQGLDVKIGAKFDFYLFQQFEDGSPSKIPLDQAGYMDIAPDDKGEDVRRQICFYLDDMGLGPESSHHEAGPGQNEIDFHSSRALRAADEAATFKWIVRIVAQSHGLYADFGPKPIRNEPGNAMSIKLTIQDKDRDAFIAGILNHLEEMTVFLNPIEESYLRFKGNKAPSLIGYSKTDPKQAIHILPKENQIEIRSADNMCNPYLVYLLILYAGLDGIKRNMKMPTVSKHLPESLDKAKHISKESEFIKQHIPQVIIDTYCK